jgi:hypothetical protein
MSGTSQEVRLGQTVRLMAGIGGSLQTTSGPLSRSLEMRLIAAAITRSDLSGIVVCGAAGVGKSRIAREALSSLASRGCEIRWAIGTSSARAPPLGAFAAWAEPIVTDRLQLVRGWWQHPGAG